MCTERTPTGAAAHFGPLAKYGWERRFEVLTRKTILAYRRMNLVETSLKGNEAANFVYLNNPKAACSTVLATLWTELRPDTLSAFRTAQDSRETPFLSQPEEFNWARNAMVFSIVRNPFTRLISAYKDKILRREQSVWNHFAGRHRLPVDDVITFDSFVEVITGENPLQADAHYRPQYLNLLLDDITPNFVGHFENLDWDFGEILARIFPGKSVTPVRLDTHATFAFDGFQAFLSDHGTLARIRAYYARDFEVYGYSPDFRDGIGPLMPSVFSDHPHDAFLKWRRDFRWLKHVARLRRSYMPNVDPALVYRLERWLAR